MAPVHNRGATIRWLAALAVALVALMVAQGAAVFLLTDVRDFRLWRVEVRQRR